MLQGGAVAQGRVEVYSYTAPNVRGTVCGDGSFDNKAATVVCRQLGINTPDSGLDYGIMVPTSTFGPGDGRILMSQVRGSRVGLLLIECCESFEINGFTGGEGGRGEGGGEEGRGPTLPSHRP